MKERILGINIFLLLILIYIFQIGCAKETSPSLWDPNTPSGSTPEITEIIPPIWALSGVTEITIKGNNFSDNMGENFVYFNEVPAEQLSASTTEIVVKAPLLVGDSIAIKIAVHGSELFSSVIVYRLEYTQLEYGDINEFSDAYGLACDLQDNIYVSLGSSKIVKITPDQEQVDFVDLTPGFFKSMKIGPGGSLYAARTKFIYKAPPEGGATIPRFTGRMPQSVTDFDFDANGNIFVSARYGIYCVKSDASFIKSADYPSTTFSSIRVYNGYVYVSGEYSGTDTNIPQKAIWRNQITSADGDLGATELTFDWFAFAGEFASTVMAITFDEDGYLYAGLDDENAITVILPNIDGNYLNGSTEQLYPGVLTPPSFIFCWGNSQYLFVNRKGINPESQRLLRITMGKNSAPYYGRQ